MIVATHRLKLRTSGEVIVRFAVVIINNILFTMIKLCPNVTQTCELPLFCYRDLEINTLTVKREDYLNIQKWNEAASLRH